MPKDTWKTSSSQYRNAIRRGVRVEQQAHKPPQLHTGTKKRRRKRKKRRRDTDLVELKLMHHVVKIVVADNELGRDTEEYSLLATLGACMGCWPRVRRTKVAEVKSRYQQMLAKLEAS